MDELFPGRWRQYEQRPDSFAEQQVKFARLAGEAALDRGEHLLECLQSNTKIRVSIKIEHHLPSRLLAQILLTWFYMTQARYVIYTSGMYDMTESVMFWLEDGQRYVSSLSRIASVCR